jgi:signal transduction histidine kinase
MRSKAANHPLLAKPRRYLTSAALVVVAVGIAGSALATISAIQRSQDLMLSRALSAAAAFSSADIKSLKGNNEDLTDASYQDIKKRLIRIQEDSPGTQFVYLMGSRNGRIFFHGDSEPEDSKDYSAPGQPYTDASLRLQGAFFDETPFIEGPLRDSYGVWMSALAPIVDNSTGEIIAVLGVDVAASDYFMQVALYAVIPLLLAAIPLTVLLRNRRLEAKEHEVLQLKTQFVSVASHELRSPLTGALWGIQSLIKPTAHPALSDAQKDTLTAVYNNTATSLATVNEILDFSIFDRNKADKLQRIETDLAAVLNDVQKVLDLSTREASVKVVHTDDWPETIQVLGDPGALKRAFSNILSNAIKYSRKGTKIELGYRRDAGRHVISVHDHGIGIPASEQVKVLEGYYRASNASKRLAHGTGMGLWITKLIIEQHDGKLWLTSKENEGTTIFVALPVGPQKTDEER